MPAPGSWHVVAQLSPGSPLGLGTGGGTGGEGRDTLHHPHGWHRLPQGTPPPCPQGWGGVPASRSPSDGALQQDLGWAPCCPGGCPGTHPACRRHLLPRGTRGTGRSENRVPILAARARQEPGQRCPGCPMGTGLRFAPEPQLGTRGWSATPGACSDPQEGSGLQNPPVPTWWFVPRGGWRAVPTGPGVPGAPCGCREGWHSQSQLQHPSTSPWSWALPQSPSSPPSFASTGWPPQPRGGHRRGPDPQSPPSLPTAPGYGQGGDGDRDGGRVHLGLSQVSRAGPHPPAMRPRRRCRCTGRFMAVGRTLVTTRAVARGGGLEGGHWLSVVKRGALPWGRISY